MNDLWNNFMALFKRRAKRLARDGLGLFDRDPEATDRLEVVESIKFLNDRNLNEWVRYKASLRQAFVGAQWEAMMAGEAGNEKTAMKMLQKATIYHELIMDVSYPELEIERTKPLVELRDKEQDDLRHED